MVKPKVPFRMGIASLVTSVLCFSLSSTRGPIFKATQFLLIHLTLVFWAKAWALRTRSVSCFGKDANGNISFPWRIFWWPWRFLLRIALKVFRGQIKKKGWEEVSSLDGAWIITSYPGPNADELLKYHPLAVIDATADLPRHPIFKNCPYLNIPSLDGQAPLPEQVEMAAMWAAEKRKEGYIVLVHCAFGIGRSTLLLCAAMVAAGAMGTWEDAYAYIRERRPVVVLNPEYVRALKEWEKVRKR
eukprot:comp4783_c0_seq1/m.920 comp4783_c0_seq1/g.920  ORF comp4783_c0_seq1/g.920 comp4783_c0_seq1/m.920 type:complete len:244 (-) comp4783_c0_seq1:133-864(-)